MNILYLGYWSVTDSITHSTIFNHLEILAEFDQVEKIIYCSIERDPGNEKAVLPYPKTVHYPLYSRHLPLSLLTKWRDFQQLPKQLNSLITRHRIDWCIGAGTQAGTLVLKATRNTTAKVIISFYDPHAEYMRALGIWKRYDPRYLYLHYWEQKLKQQADYLFPVSKGYHQTLLKENVSPEKLFTVPCTVNTGKFKPDNAVRQGVREELGFGKEDIVGIYVGKFGDIYFGEEAFDWFKTIKQTWPDFKLIILTAHDQRPIAQKLIEAGYSPGDYFLDLVPHAKVAIYLNAADFALSLIKPHAYSHAYSPIKHGEYWACGLPILLPANIGDDSEIINNSNLGIIANNIEQLREQLPKIHHLFTPEKKDLLRQLAVTHRNSQHIIMAYRQIFENI